MMKRLVVEDVVSCAVDNCIEKIKYYYTLQKGWRGEKITTLPFESCTILGAGDPLSGLMAPAVDALVRKKIIPSLTVVDFGKGVRRYDFFKYANTQFASGESLSDKKKKNGLFLFFVDCEDGQSAQEFIAAAQAVIDRQFKGKKSRCIVCAMLPQVPDLPGGVEALAEREYSYFVEDYITEKTPGQLKYIEIEKFCRSLMQQGVPTSLLRFDNLFGAEANCIRGIDLESIVKCAFEEGVMRVSGVDFRREFTCTYVNDAIAAIFHAVFYAQVGHVYNFTSFHTTLAQMKLEIAHCFENRLALECSAQPVEGKSYSGISRLKFDHRNWYDPLLVKTTFSQAMQTSACFFTGEGHDNRDNVSIYSGRLAPIKAVEIDILREIDRICRENDIKYFIAGGTMLGALRYGHSIPWDDDYDIGMLRADFDKFRKLCNSGALGDDYVYSCYYNETKSHYVVDKVRRKDTYFSTNYSSIHEIPDGVFIDVIVYDQTSSNKKLAMLHCKAAYAFQRLVNRLWREAKAKNIRHLSMKILYPLLHLVPLKFWQWCFERVLTLYKHKKNAKYVIDGCGKLTAKGPMKIDGLREVKYVPFDDGFMAPVPEDPTDYLVFDYGPSYMSEPPLSKRVAPHNFARIDLGGFVFNMEDGKRFRAVNLRGELYEEDAE